MLLVIFHFKRLNLSSMFKILMSISIYQTSILRKFNENIDKILIKIDISLKKW